MDHPVRSASLTEAIPDVAHPLDPLSAREIARAASIIRAHFPWGDDLRVETIDIEDRPKSSYATTCKELRSPASFGSTSTGAA
jgi:Cu2+-containing amine oxidase